MKINTQQLAVSVTNLSSGYGDKKDIIKHPERNIIHDISFSIAQGSSVSILGSNGCGKTTLLRSLSRLLPYTGKVEIFGHDIAKMKRKEIASYVAMMSQLQDVYFSYTIKETVEMGRYIRGGIKNTHDIEMVDRCLEMTGLSGIYNKQINQLSGGQLQRVFLARTIAQETPVILLDEPTNHLDLKYQSELLEYLQRWSREKTVMPDGQVYKNTLIGVFHDIGLAAKLSKHMIFMKDGQIIADGQKKEVFTSDNLKKAYDMDVAAYMNEQKKIWENV